MPVQTTGSAAAEQKELFSRRLLALGDKLQHFLALLAPGIELVGLETVLPRGLGLVLIATEPVRAPQLVIRLDQIRTQRERLLEKRFGILIHLALQVHEPEIKVRIQRRLFVVVQPNRLGEVLDRLTEDPFFETDIADVDPRE